ncbi:hypothetical protein N9153_02695 [Planctomicrobium sp.]|jgi:hypothetical protein|nr:hypothetical protein [Planctomicrobium sp.]MDB4731684.1 hypothetical protein [bacterium]
MKLSGQNIETVTVQPFSLRRPHGDDLNFQISPLPLSFQSSLRKHGIVTPIAPLKITRDSTGKPLRDSNCLAITHADQSDSSYLEGLELYHQRVAVLAIVEALRNDPSISFEAAIPPEQNTSGDSWMVFADTIFEEFEKAGFTSGDLISFCDEICKLSNMLDHHLQEAQRNFSSQLRTNST